MIIAQLARAIEEQAHTIRELEAPQESAETAETVEQEPEKAVTRFAMAEAQEAKEHT